MMCSHILEAFVCNSFPQHCVRSGFMCHGLPPTIALVGILLSRFILKVNRGRCLGCISMRSKGVGAHRGPSYINTHLHANPPIPLTFDLAINSWFGVQVHSILLNVKSSKTSTCLSGSVYFEPASSNGDNNGLIRSPLTSSPDPTVGLDQQPC